MKRPVIILLVLIAIATVLYFVLKPKKEIREVKETEEVLPEVLEEQPGEAVPEGELRKEEGAPEEEGEETSPKTEREKIQQYYSTIKEIDEIIAKRIDELEKAGASQEEIKKLRADYQTLQEEIKRVEGQLN